MAVNAVTGGVSGAYQGGYTLNVAGALAYNTDTAVDGVNVTGSTTTRTLANTTAALQIGTAGSTSFAGSVDEVALYNAALSATRIQAHYRAAH